jgi:hypothetical protein
MTLLLIHLVVAFALIAYFFYVNAYLYRGGWQGSGVTALEWLYYVICVCSFALGYYFNVQYVTEYPAEASWVHFTKLLFTNPAADSGSQDLVCTNVILFPLWTIIDGRRLKMKAPWIYFVLSLLTSFGFGFALYLAAHERQIRWLRAHGQANQPLAAT